MSPLERGPIINQTVPELHIVRTNFGAGVMS